MRMSHHLHFFHLFCFFPFYFPQSRTSSTHLNESACIELFLTFPSFLLFGSVVCFLQYALFHICSFMPPFFVYTQTYSTFLVGF